MCILAHFHAQAATRLGGSWPALVVSGAHPQSSSYIAGSHPTRVVAVLHAVLNMSLKHKATIPPALPSLMYTHMASRQNAPTQRHHHPRIMNACMYVSIIIKSTTPDPLSRHKPRGGKARPRFPRSYRCLQIRTQPCAILPHQTVYQPHRWNRPCRPPRPHLAFRRP